MFQFVFRICSLSLAKSTDGGRGRYGMRRGVCACPFWGWPGMYCIPSMVRSSLHQLLLRPNFGAAKDHSIALDHSISDDRVPRSLARNRVQQARIHLCKPSRRCHLAPPVVRAWCLVCLRCLASSRQKLGWWWSGRCEGRTTESLRPADERREEAPRPVKSM